MPDSMMYYEDDYVILDPNLVERFVTLAELKELLSELLADIQDNLPSDLLKLPALDDRVERLLKTTCQLDCGDRGIWQWYVVRLKK